MRYSIRCASAWQLRNEYVISIWRDFVTPSIARCVLSFGENNRSSENNNFTLVICLAHLAYIKHVFMLILPGENGSMPRQGRSEKGW